MNLVMWNLNHTYIHYSSIMDREFRNRREKRFHFWWQWLYYSSLLFALTGLILALYGNNPLFAPYHTMLANIFFHQDGFPEGTQALYGFILGPMGATIAGIYLLLAFIARYPFRRKEKWARNAIIVSFSIWFVTDAVVAIFYGVLIHSLVIHLLVSVPQKALPIIFTWKEFEE